MTSAFRSESYFDFTFKLAHRFLGSTGAWLAGFLPQLTTAFDVVDIPPIIKNDRSGFSRGSSERMPRKEGVVPNQTRSARCFSARGDSTIGGLLFRTEQAGSPGAVLLPKRPPHGPLCPWAPPGSSRVHFPARPDGNGKVTVVLDLQGVKFLRGKNLERRNENGRQNGTTTETRREDGPTARSWQWYGTSSRTTATRCFGATSRTTETLTNLPRFATLLLLSIGQ